MGNQLEPVQRHLLIDHQRQLEEGHQGAIALWWPFLLEDIMTKQQREAYQDTEVLREIIKSLKGRKFKLDCGHYATLCHSLGTDITIRNGKDPVITCSLCGY